MPAPAPSFVQNCNGGGTGSGNSATFAGAQTAGNSNLVLVIVFYSSRPTFDVPTDTAHNTYVPIGSPLFNDTAGIAIAAYWCSSIVAAAANTNTISSSTPGGATTNGGVIGIEITGAGSVDIAGAPYDSTTSIATFSLGPNAANYANELALFYIACSGGNFVNATPSGWTGAYVVGDFNDDVYYQDVASPGNVSASGTLSGSATWVALLMSFAPPQGISVPFWAA